MTPNKILLSVLAAAVLIACGRPLFYAELEEPRLCKTIPAEDLFPFPGTSPGAELRAELPIPLGAILEPITAFGQGDADGGTAAIDLDTTVRLIEFTLVARSGVTDFNAVETVAISVVPEPGSGLERATLLNYTRDPAHLPGDRLTVAGDENVNLAEYIGQSGSATLPDGGTVDGTVRFEAVMTGTLPENEWTADMRACVFLKTRINYLNAYGL